MRLALSTSILEVTAAGSEAAARFVGLLEGAGQTLAGAVDGRLEPAQQASWLECLCSAGVEVIELAHPLVGERRRQAPSAVSNDKTEQAAAAQLLLGTLRRAAEREVRRVVLYPGMLALGPSVASLQWRFGRGEPVDLESLSSQRAALAGQALDGLRRVLDQTLNLADALGLRLALPGPCPWPHQLPRWKEVESLITELAGAPLEPIFFMDWALAAAELGCDDGFPRATPSARVADGSGLRLRLPLGTGEASWPEQAQPRADEPRSLLVLPGEDVEEPEPQPVPAPEDAVLTFDPDCSGAELERSLAWLTRHVHASAT